MSKRSAYTRRGARDIKVPRIAGVPRIPKRSIYYDPVFNPYGNPPPGMPYRERSKHCADPSTDSTQQR